MSSGNRLVWGGFLSTIAWISIEIFIFREVSIDGWLTIRIWSNVSNLKTGFREILLPRQWLTHCCSEFVMLDVLLRISVKHDETFLTSGRQNSAWSSFIVSRHRHRIENVLVSPLQIFHSAWFCIIYELLLENIHAICVYLALYAGCVEFTWVLIISYNWETNQCI